MRWEELFEDLEAQLDAESRRDLDSEIADRTRRERAAVHFPQRVARCIGSRVEIRTVGGAAEHGLVLDVGADWVLLQEGGRLSLVPLGSVVGIVLDQPGTQVRPAQAIPRPLSLGYVLRALARDRAPVAVLDVTGLSLTGTVDSVGVQWLELAEHASDLPPRPENVLGRRVIPFTAVAVVRRLTDG